MAERGRYRLTVVASHPVQYNSAWFRALAELVDLEVLYCHRPTAGEQGDGGFGVAFGWDVPLLNGYQHRFVANRAARPSLQRFSGCDTPQIGALLGRERIDACLVLGWHFKSYLQAWRACRSRHIPLLCRGDSQLRTRRSWWKRLAKGLVYPPFLGSFAGHLAVGRRNRSYLEHYGVRAERIFSAPHCVDNAWWRERGREARSDRSRIRHEWGVPDGATAALFVGKLVERKRPLDLVEALGRCDRPVHGVIAGDGPLRSELASSAAGRDVPLSLLGFRNQTELPAVYAGADVLVLPSEAEETWGLVVNEALACGTMAIVSDAVGCGDDLIVQGATGYVFPKGDVAALTELLLRVPARTRPEPRVLDRILGRHAPESTATGVLRALERVLAAVPAKHGGDRP